MFNMSIENEETAHEFKLIVNEATDENYSAISKAVHSRRVQSWGVTITLVNCHFKEFIIPSSATMALYSSTIQSLAGTSHSIFVKDANVFIGEIENENNDISIFLDTTEWLKFKALGKKGKVVITYSEQPMFRLFLYSNNFVVEASTKMLKGQYKELSDLFRFKLRLIKSGFKEQAKF